MVMKKTILIITAVLGLGLGQASAQRLVIAHVNDTHSHLDAERDGMGGIIERAAFIDSLRKAEGRSKVLLLHAGDFNQGTSYYTVMKGELEVKLVNALKYDAMTFGNHEFDNGIEDLTARVKKVKTRFVCCNYDFSSFELGKYVKPYTIIKRGGMKIGVIGVLTDISKVVSRVTVDRLPALDTSDEVNRWADYLKNEKKCDMVILLSHLGYDGTTEYSDKGLIPLVRNVDLVVGGHSHTFMKKIDYDHKDLDGKIVPIVQDGCWGQDFGVIKIY